jgi:hypothetical protein
MPAVHVVEALSAVIFGRDSLWGPPRLQEESSVPNRDNGYRMTIKETILNNIWKDDSPYPSWIDSVDTPSIVNSAIQDWITGNGIYPYNLLLFVTARLFDLRYYMSKDAPYIVYNSYPDGYTLYNGECLCLEGTDVVCRLLNMSPSFVRFFGESSGEQRRNSFNAIKVAAVKALDKNAICYEISNNLLGFVTQRTESFFRQILPRIISMGFNTKNIYRKDSTIILGDDEKILLIDPAYVKVAGFTKGWEYINPVTKVKTRVYDVLPEESYFRMKTILSQGVCKKDQMTLYESSTLKKVIARYTDTSKVDQFYERFNVSESWNIVPCYTFPKNQ